MTDAAAPLAGLRVVAFESRRAEELARLLERHGAAVTSAPALAEVRLAESPRALELVRRLEAGEVAAVILLTGVGTRALAAAAAPATDRFPALLGAVPIVARGPKPLAALRELGVSGATPVPAPHTWREALGVLDALALPSGSLVAVQEYGAPPTALVVALESRGLRVLRVPVYRWALPADTGPLERAAAAIARHEVEVAVFTSAVQVEHLFRVAADAEALRAGLRQSVVASIGPVCSEALEAHGVSPHLEPSPPKLGPLAALLAERVPGLVQRGAARGASASLRTLPASHSTAAVEATSAAPFLAACRRQPVPFTPVWLMRQAGRYQPEYRAIREKLGFLGLCKTPSAAAEVTVMAVEQLGVDAAIVFADILLILEPMGVGLEYAKGDGPVIQRPVHTPADVDRLSEVDPADLAYVAESVRLARAALKVPLIGFAGAPFTLASYLIEGGGSRDYLRTKRFFLDDAGAWCALMEHLVRATAGYLNAQIDAGAQAVQLFDSWVGCLSPADYRTHVLPHVRALLLALRPGVPVIHFGTGTAGLLECQRDAGGDVIGIDWRIDLDAAWARLGPDVAVQGNLDPATLLAPIPEIERRVAAILKQAGGRPGHVFNLGHGVLQTTPVDHARAVVDAVHELSAR